MLDWIIRNLYWIAVVAIIGIAGFSLYAHVSTCGWKGLFVECRITR